MGPLVVACDDSFEPADPDPGTEATIACEAGLSRAADASLVITQFAVNGAGLTPQFDQGAVYSGVPAACSNADGTEVRLIFEVTGQPYAEIALSHSGPGTYDPNVDAGVLTVDLFGADTPVTYATGDWQTTSLNVGAEDEYVTSDFFGTGFSGDQNITLAFQLSVAP